MQKKSCVHCARLLEEIKELRDLVYLDPLTGLGNRREFERQLKDCMQYAERVGAKLSIAEIDLDHFKMINDRFGHIEGDRVLREFSSILIAMRRSGDCTIRLGGEEFVVILKDCGVNGAVAYFARVYDEIYKKLIIKKEQEAVVRITVSLGLTEFVSGDTTESFFARADAALYQAKHGGRNRIIVA